MDEKTEELRDIFLDVTEEETLTEQQEESPGTLADEGDVEARIDTIVERMQERYTFDSELSDDGLRSVARGFYDDRTDEAIAEELGVDPATVFAARLDLHLLKDDDRDVPFAFDAFRRTVLDDEQDALETFDAPESDLERWRSVVLAEQEMRRANYRFRDEFDDLLGDGDLAEHLTRDVTDDGLAEATEDLEINTGF